MDLLTFGTAASMMRCMRPHCAGQRRTGSWASMGQDCSLRSITKSYLLAVCRPRRWQCLFSGTGRINSFKKEKYFNVHIAADGLTADLEKVKSEEDAKKITTACNQQQAVVSSLEKTQKTANPPKLYDLTTLQREANRYYGFTAQQTLDLVQSLYEKKLLTYPRTDSQFVTDDMSDTVRRVVSLVYRFISLFHEMEVEPDIKRVTNNAKVTDHHAIIPTAQLEKQDLSTLPVSEQKILNLVAMRLLAATGEKHVYEETAITITCGGYSFKAKGKTIVRTGWNAVETCFRTSLKDQDIEEKDNIDAEKVLPVLTEGQSIPAVAATFTEHFTQPPKPYSEDTLLSAMETAGNEDFDEDTEKKGLGTPATRAGIIEKLVKSGFVQRKGKSLVPTKTGATSILCPAGTAHFSRHDC